MALKRRHKKFILYSFFITAALIFSVVISLDFVLNKFAADFRDIEKNHLSPSAEKLVNLAFDGLEGKTIYDYHVHWFGLGTGLSQSCPATESLPKPFINIDKFIGTGFVSDISRKGWLMAVDVKDESTFDEDYFQRLLKLAQYFGPVNGAPGVHAQFFLLPMDQVYDDNGEALTKDSYFYIPNDYLLAVTECLNQKLKTLTTRVQVEFITAGSINPERKDWNEQITLLKEHQVKWIKWRPPTMDFDPNSEKHTAFYEELKKAGIGILSHTGRSVSAKVAREKDEWASPHSFELPLKMGIPVVMLHMGRIGFTGSELHSEFLDLQKKYKNLFGEISALPYVGSLPLLPSLWNEELVPSLANGSDYPAVTPRTDLPIKALVKEGYLSKDEARSLNEIYSYNPLLFEFVLKRTLKNPENHHTLSESIFTKAL